MPDPDLVRVVEIDPSDARRRCVERMLEDALADLRGGRTPPCHRAVLVLGWVEDGGLHVRPYCAGVDLTSAVGLLDVGKMELYSGGDRDD